LSAANAQAMAWLAGRLSFDPYAPPILLTFTCKVQNFLKGPKGAQKNSQHKKLQKKELLTYFCQDFL
jgi:hypothetical protein